MRLDLEAGKERMKINIAIDGPAGAGKSTVARLVATKLGYIYIDTGAMYRAVTVAALRAGVQDDSESLAAMAGSLAISLEAGEEKQRVLLGGEDVTEEIRSREVTLHVSQVAANETVRQLLAGRQREMAAGKGVVMDGRDIGSHVLPDAELKIYLTASVQVRALRRYEELAGKQDIQLQQLEQEIAERDRKDEQREVAPLVRASDAILVDSTGMSVVEVTDEIVRLCRTKLAEAK